MLAMLAIAPPSLGDKPLPAALTATPSSTTLDPDVMIDVRFTGCGYLPSAGTTLVVHTPSAISFFGGPSDASGCIDQVHNGFVTSAGTYDVEAWQDNAQGRQVLMATTSFVIDP